MCMVATIALGLSKGNKEFKEKNKKEFFFFNHDISPSLSVMMMQVKLLFRERHLCSGQHYQPDSRVLIDDLQELSSGSRN